MNDWNEGYFTESTYTFGYYGELNPTYQRFRLLLEGFYTPPLAGDENHCELGYGQGVSINIHAAANPGNYFGTDFNPSHAAHAKSLCEASGSGAQLFEESFEEMVNRADLPKFDSISLHGIWSWISPENQRHIVEFARKFLKSGGILYNSYNCYPGWSPAAPLRELFVLHDKYAHKSGKTFNRVEEALNFTEKVLAQPQGYFGRVPDVQKIFEQTKKLNHDYLAHEYFNRNWACMYFSEVAEIFQAAKLDFVCTAPLVEKREQLMLPQNCLEFLNTLENPIMREQVKDYFLNRQFRKDYLIRGGVKLSAAARLNQILATDYILADKNPLPAQIKVGNATVNLNADLVEKVYRYLASAEYCAKNFNEFVRQNAGVPFAGIEDLLIVFVNGGRIIPCQSAEVVEKVSPRCRALNKYICERAKFADEVQHLASPVTGGGIALNRFERIFTAAVFDGKNTADEISEYAWEVFRSQGQSLVIQGKTLQTAAENISQFKTAAVPFVEKRLPLLRALRVV